MLLIKKHRKKYVKFQTGKTTAINSLQLSLSWNDKLWRTQKWTALHKNILIFNKAIYTFLLGLQAACAAFPKPLLLNWKLWTMSSFLTWNCLRKYSWWEEGSNLDQRGKRKGKQTKEQFHISDGRFSYLEMRKEYIVFQIQKLSCLK